MIISVGGDQYIITESNSTYYYMEYSSLNDPTHSKPPLDDRVICIVHPNENAYSETFIRNHIERLPAKVIVLHRGSPELQNIAGLGQFLWEHNVEAVLAEYIPTGVALMNVCEAAGLPLIVHTHGEAMEAVVLENEGHFYPELFHKLAVIVAPTEFIKNQLLDLGVPLEKIQVNTNGVDPSIFCGANPATSEPVFLTVSRFVDLKGPHLTLLAFAKAIESFGEAHLIMVGDGVLLESCKQIALALKIDKNVKFLGVKNPWEIAELMRSARAFLQHSIQTSDGQCEAQGVVFLEAGASGLPVITTRSAGIPEVVIDGETGFLVAEADVDAMADRILRLIKDPLLAAQLGQAARQRICAEFSMEKSISGLWSIIDTAIEKHRKQELIYSFNLREINLIVFPDWLQPENSLIDQLASVILLLFKHPESARITLLIYRSDVSDEESNLFLSTVLMKIMMEEELDDSIAPEICLLPELSARKWVEILPTINYCLILNQENKAKTSSSELSNIPALNLDELALLS
jgi:glycosyltransferase involved in cell wall biosynthesis